MYRHGFFDFLNVLLTGMACKALHFLSGRVYTSSSHKGKKSLTPVRLTLQNKGKGSVAQLVEQGIENSFWPVFTVLLGLSKPLFCGNKQARAKFVIALKSRFVSK